MQSNYLKIVAWNANGLTQRSLEIKQFLIDHSPDIVLVSETHFTSKSYLSIPNYSIFLTNHPSGRGHGGCAILIKNSIKCSQTLFYNYDFMQSTIIDVQTEIGSILIAAIYCPPRHTISSDQYNEFLKLLGPRFVVGGDFNAKHTNWGSRITNTKGNYLLKSISKNNCNHISTGEPTYWPTDQTKKPDLIDFFIYKGISSYKMSAHSCFDLSSDHSPIILNIEHNPVHINSNQKIHNSKTNWCMFKEIIEETLCLDIPLQNQSHIETAIVEFNYTVSNSAIMSTPILKIHNEYSYTPPAIQKLIRKKRKLRKTWQSSRYSIDKTNFNKATSDLKKALKKLEDETIRKKLSSLTATSATDYSLWKTTKSLTKTQSHNPPIKNANNTWAKTNLDKAISLAHYFENIFSNDNASSTQLPPLDSCNDSFQIEPFTCMEIKQSVKNNVKHKKSAGYDLITPKILIELPNCAYIYIRNIYNAMVRLQYFPKSWKVAEIIPIPKVGKDPSLTTSYRPISLLPILSKVFERLFLSRIEPYLIQKNLIPSHQFGFRKGHSTIQQVHRVTNKIATDIDQKRFCIALYLDVAKAFDKVWHEGLLFKLNKYLPYTIFKILKSYLKDRYFYVKFKDKTSALLAVNSGVPQGSVLGPILYLLYTADIPIPSNQNSMIATFADDTVLLSSHSSINTATNVLQNMLNNIIKWFDYWNLKINEDKTIQVIYTNKKNYCPTNITVRNISIEVSDSAKYLGMYIDKKLSWKAHIDAKCKQLRLRLREVYWLISRNSPLSLENKLLIYKMILKPIWTYGIEIWGTAAMSNLKPIQVLQSKILRIILNTRRYIPIYDIHRDTKIPLINEEITLRSRSYIEKLSHHVNIQAQNIPTEEQSTRRRLKRLRPSDLICRFENTH